VPPLASHLVAGLSAVVDAGLLPGAPAAGIEAALGWSQASTAWRVRATAAGAVFAPGLAGSEATGGQTERFSLWTASARTCLSRVFSRVEAGPCLGLELDRMVASGTGSQEAFEPANASAVWAAALAAGAVHWSLTPRVSLQMRAEAVVTPAQQRFVLQPGSLLVHQTSRLAGRVALGLEVRFF
jgi:hypothetical protein